jgi:hypothetical protein
VPSHRAKDEWRGRSANTQGFLINSMHGRLVLYERELAGQLQAVERQRQDLQQ